MILFSRLLLSNLVFALIYAASAWLSALVSPASATLPLLGLPAGVALGALLVRGSSLLPGVFLGAMALWWPEFHPPGDHGTWPVSALAVTLQAWLAFTLARRWVGHPSALETTRRVALLLLVIVPLSAMVQPGLELFLGASSHPPQAALQPWTWALATWTANTLGMLLTVPLILIWLGEPAAAWRSRIKMVAWPMLLALLLVVTGHQSLLVETGPHWLGSASSLLAVGLMGAVLLALSGHSRRTLRLVQRRTEALARSNERLARLAHFDPLTGLCNRIHWMKQAETALAASQLSGEPMAIMFLDLDHFKRINDSLGHSQGDLLLQTVARRMRECLRPRDVLARLGGDEFVVLLPKLKEREGAEVVARKIVRLLAEPIQLAHHEVTVSASLGLAFYPGDGQTIETLLRHADTAMYAVKDNGRNGWRFFSPEMHEHLSRRMLIESGLRRALQPDANELHLMYQPQIDARTGTVRGMEALVRWRHPAHGLISPEEFIPVAEDAGLIEPLGQWILRSACEQLRTWQTQTDSPELAHLNLAINISALEFNRPMFMRHLTDTITSAGVDPSRLELEITESLLMDADSDLLDRLDSIQGMGLTLTLDDFGTGYSSLGYLKRLPLRTLKIDRSFIIDIPGDAEDEAIVRATLSMAHDLGLEVVAEGVETAAQRDFLLRHHCDALQGWLYSPALMPSAIPGWMMEHRHRATGSKALPQTA